MQSFTKSKNTLRAYRRDFRDFREWCRSKGLSELPADPATIAAYVDDISEKYKATTIKRKLMAIAKAHELSKPGHAPTKTRIVYEALRRIYAKKHEFPEAKSPILASDVRKALAGSKPETIQEIRDRAIFLLGYAGAFKRGELVELTVDSLHEFDEGYVILLNKTDVEGDRLTKVLHQAKNNDFCPVRALQRWLEVSGIKEGSVFRHIDKVGRINKKPLSAQSISIIVRRVLDSAGMRKTNVASHSLRSGFIVDLTIAGVEKKVIMRHTGHKREDTLNQYDRLAARLKENLVQQVGL